MQSSTSVRTHNSVAWLERLEIRLDDDCTEKDRGTSSDAAAPAMMHVNLRRFRGSFLWTSRVACFDNRERRLRIWIPANSVFDVRPEGSQQLSKVGQSPLDQYMSELVHYCQTMPWWSRGIRDLERPTSVISHPGSAQWLKIRNTSYSQWAAGRSFLKESGRVIGTSLPLGCVCAACHGSKAT